MTEQERLALVQSHQISYAPTGHNFQLFAQCTCGWESDDCADQAALNRASVGHLVHVQAVAEGVA